MTGKAKTRVEMPEQPEYIRRNNFEEVALGYTEELALMEAERCIQCRRPKCVEGCPVSVDIPGFIKLITEKKWTESLEKIYETNFLPAICGRVCPQETQCEELCILNRKENAIAIGRLERYVADRYYESPESLNEKGRLLSKREKPTGKKIAVVGSGPAGLTAAATLSRMGHSVVIYESLHKPGGVLTYGIPSFRLPKEIIKREVDEIKYMGVEIKLNYVIGRIKTLEELSESYDAVFIGSGAGLPNFMGIEGESLNGVYSANEFLTRVNLMQAWDEEYDTIIRKGKNVVVVGGGNVAMDAARSALRLGADNVTVVYRRSDTELPARREEIEHAKKEGVQFRFLTNPTKIIGDYGDEKVRKYDVKSIECIEMELGEEDSSGRRRPIPIPGTEFEIEADVVIIAIGTSPNPLIFNETPDLEKTKWGTVVVNDDLKCTKENVFAGGDIVTGAATVISAMGAGKKAAESIDEYLKNK
ncbi:MAG: NADPH-dependent glutamate synthase [Methanosarcinaceae archaeon]|nr:NADPH-dependent glutamate synthase [Methanosarcinaceae archaeon]